MKRYRFTLAVVLSMAIALVFPQYFIEISGFPVKRLIVPLLQVIMFGMGATMSWQEFRNVAAADPCPDESAGGRLAGLDEQSCRTVSIEVGLQNAGIASGLALKLGKFATMGLAAALFGPLMNFTGSLLANWWNRRPGR